MAIIWFFKSGKVQTGPMASEKSLDWCVKNLGLQVDDWIAPLETKQLRIGEEENDSRRAPYRGFRFAVVQLNDDDVKNNNSWKTGFYLLEKSATEVRAILDTGAGPPYLVRVGSTS